MKSAQSKYKVVFTNLVSLNWFVSQVEGNKFSPIFTLSVLYYGRIKYKKKMAPTNEKAPLHGLVISLIIFVVTRSNLVKIIGEKV